MGALLRYVVTPFIFPKLICLKRCASIDVKLRTDL
jgi:hypothetical protein